MKKLVVIFLSLSMLFPNIAFGETSYSDVDVSHWAYEAIHHVSELGIIDEESSFGMGTPVSLESYITWINEIGRLYPQIGIRSDLTVEDVTAPISRLDAIVTLIGAFGLDAQAETLRHSEIPFIDSNDKVGYIKMALDFNWLTVNPEKTFRPNDYVTREEAVTILYRAIQKIDSPMPHLMSYYAISSYSQAEISSHLSDLAYGWSRFELDPSNGLTLNMSASNSNEYSVPSQYTLAFDATLRDETTPYLMLFVKEDYVYDSDLKKQVSLTEYILSDKTRRETAIDAVEASLKQFPQFKGVLVDFEGLKGADNALNLSLFLEGLREVLGDSYKIATAVHPPRAEGIAYYDGYDFRKIGAVSDLIVLMAHDYYPKKLTESEMESGLTITPLSPFDEIYYAIKVILDSEKGIEDSEKLVLQISIDSAQWKVSDGRIINSRPYNPTYSAILERIESGAILDYSKKYQNPTIVFENESDLTRNIVWFEDSKSVQAKINLAYLLDLGGISIWRLGTIPDFEESVLDIWTQIKSNYE